MTRHQSSFRFIRKTELIDRGNQFIPPFKQIKNVVVVPFIEEGKLVCGLQNGKMILPSRRTQIYDEDCVDTVQRELREGIGIITKELKLLKVLQSNYYGSQPDELTYITIFATLATKLLYGTSGLGRHCRLQRKVVSVENFFREHQSRHRELIEEIVVSGKSLAFDCSSTHLTLEDFKIDRLQVKIEQEQATRRARKSWLYDNQDYVAGVSISNFLKRRDMWIYC